MVYGVPYMDGYYFVIKLPSGVAGNHVPAESPGELAGMFIKAYGVVVDHGFVEPDVPPPWRAFAVEAEEERDLTPLEDAALLATFEQTTGERHEWERS